MGELVDTILRLKEKGYRLTRARRMILAVFKESPQPIAPKEILASLAKKQVVVNKTTVYREVDFLVKEGVLEEIQFDERTKRYELNEYHHHHAVCGMCSRVEKIDSRDLEKALSLFEKQTVKKLRFINLSHRLEFFGRCEKCAK